VKPDNRIEIIPNQPTLFDLLALAEAVAKVNDSNFTKAMAEALHRVNRPAAIFKVGEG
jgi:hypothetical protein